MAVQELQPRCSISLWGMCPHLCYTCIHTSVAQSCSESVNSLLNQQICRLTPDVHMQPNIFCAPHCQSTLAYDTLQLSNLGSTYFAWIIFTVCTKSHQHQDRRTSEGETHRWQRMPRRPSLPSPQASGCTQALPSTAGAHEAKSFTTETFTREADRSKFLSGIILPITEGFRSTMSPILSQCGEMRTDLDSRNQTLSSVSTVANPDMWARFYSAELVISIILLKLAL